MNFLISCYLLAAVSFAASGDAVSTFENSVVAAALGTSDRAFKKAAFCVMIASLTVKGRLIGAFGYLARLFDNDLVADPLLSLHHGLLSFDSIDVPVIAKLANAGIALAWATTTEGASRPKMCVHV